MKKNAFYDLFIRLLQDIFNSENQVIENLPTVVKAVSHETLKEALNEHLEETKNQVQRLKKIFKMLNENPTGVHCKAMKGLIEEAVEEIGKNASSSVKDAALIICCQKIEHHEIASYGSARALARHLNEADIDERIDFDEIADILQQTLDEESGADEKLTDIAEGGFFTEGINDEAKAEMQSIKKKTL